MQIQMFNSWYFFWIILLSAITAGLYFLLKNKSPKIQDTVLFSLLLIGLVLHFLKIYIPPYSENESLMLREIWFVNICGANIGLFPFLFLSKNKMAREYMVYFGIISGFLAIVYPVEPIEKANQLAEQLDIIRFYYHHWMLMAVPLLMVMLKRHKPSYRRILTAPTGLLVVMLFIILNQLFQSELGFVPLRNDSNFFDINYRNNSYIWGPKDNDTIGRLFATFTPEIFKTVPVGEFADQAKYWPWFWMIIPVYVIITPLAFIIALIFDGKSIATDSKRLLRRVRRFVRRRFLNPIKKHNA